MRFLPLLFAVLACTTHTPPPLPGPVARDTLYVTDTLLVIDSVRVTDTVTVADTVTDTVAVRRVEPLNVTVSASPFHGDSLYTVRRIVVKPDSVSTKPGQQIQFCPWLVFGKTGQFAQPAQFAKLTACAASLHFTPRAIERWHQPDQLQQLIADHACFKWEATGGTVTAQQC